MKARIPKIKARDKKQIKQEIDILVTAALAEKEEKIHKDLTRRILKTFVYVMNTEFGYGRTRLERLLEAFTIQLEKSDTDEVFWEHRGAMQEALGLKKDARKSYNKLKKLNPKHPAVLKFFGKKK